MAGVVPLSIRDSLNREPIKIDRCVSRTAATAESHWTPTHSTLSPCSVARTDCCADPVTPGRAAQKEGSPQEPDPEAVGAWSR